MANAALKNATGETSSSIGIGGFVDLPLFQTLLFYIKKEHFIIPRMSAAIQKDFYKTLHLTRSATAEEVRKAYRHLALKVIIPWEILGRLLNGPGNSIIPTKARILMPRITSRVLQNLSMSCPIVS